MHGEEGGNAAAFEVLAAHDMTRPFGGNKDDIDSFGRTDGFVVDGEAVTKQQALALAEIGGDILFIDRGNLEIGNCDKDDIGRADGFSRGKNFQAVLLGNSDRLAAFVEADGDFHPAIFQIEGMGMALGAEADDGHTAAFQGCEGGVFVGVDAGGHSCISS